MGAQPQEHLPGINWEIIGKSVGKGLGEMKVWVGDGLGKKSGKGLRRVAGTLQGSLQFHYTLRS